MERCNAIRLHNEDEVISKETGESIRVLSSRFEDEVVIIEGVGDKSGYSEWTHKEVK